MNQQLAAIATGFAELPTNIAKSLADVMVSSSTTMGPAPLTSSSRVVLLPQLDRKNFKHITHWTPELYNSIRKNKAKKEDEGESGDDESTPGTSSTSSGSSKDKVSKLSIYMEDENGNVRLLRVVEKLISISGTNSCSSWRRVSPGSAIARTTGRLTGCG